ncbi:ribosomal L1 domain-containing protein 1-like [Stegastes partitus]|nr:PREDICTED: ribosomal L1 domain-containing protein 1-like [Stegastes partitus]
MAEKTEVALDRAQVKKAVQALQAFLKTKASGESLFLDETQQVTLLFTLWKIPKKPQTIRIPLPHGQRTDTDEICLFTRDEPKMTSEQTQRFYKKFLEEKGVKNISEIIPYKVLKTEYKPYEAKRRLLGNFDLFLSDARIRRLLPSHIGKHFYERKK